MFYETGTKMYVNVYLPALCKLIITFRPLRDQRGTHYRTHICILFHCYSIVSMV